MRPPQLASLTAALIACDLGYLDLKIARLRNESEALIERLRLLEQKAILLRTNPDQDNSLQSTAPRDPIAQAKLFGDIATGMANPVSTDERRAELLAIRKELED